MAEITVNDFAGFKSALEDPDYDVIHLGADINFTSAGVLIPRTKTNIVVDGHGFTITDYNSLAPSNMIRYVNTAGSDFSFTLKNTVWSGHNFYGVVYANPNSNFSNFTLAFDNVTYTGPQAVYNRTGTTRFKDSTFNIERNGSGSVPEELGEVNNVVVEGNVTVNAQTAGTSILWFLNSPSSLTVEDNAVFTVNAPDTYMFYTDGTPPPNMLFKSGSDTNIRTRWGLFYGVSETAYIASTFVLDAGASFTSTQSDRRAVPTFKCRDNLSVGPGSSLFISAEASGTSPLMYFPATATLNFNDPKSVVLYNNGGNVFQFGSGTAGSPNTINIDTELLNMWTSAGSGDFDDLPTRGFAKEGGSNITATINTSTTTTTAVSSNIADGDKGYPMTQSTFNVMQAKVISMGRLDISLDDVRDISTAITGTTESSANLRAAYEGTTLSGTAGAGGEINLPIPLPIEVGTEITFGSNWKFLTKYITVISLGSVTITYLTDLYFITTSIPCRRTPIKRKDTDWYIEITDTRDGGNDWLLYNWIEGPMASGVYTLDDRLVLTNGGSSEILSTTPILVRRQAWTQQGEVTQISWAELEGFLLRLDPDYYYQSGKYITQMHWEVKEDE